jgi:autoinducer 2-degrading protein
MRRFPDGFYHGMQATITLAVRPGNAEADRWAICPVDRQNTSGRSTKNTLQMPMHDKPSACKGDYLMYAIFVTIKVKPGFADKFKEASLGDAQGSVRDEPGCLRFDMHQSTSDPNTFHLYEVYENQDAHMQAHRNAPHYIKWRETVQDWFDGEPQRVAMTTIFPSDGGWRQQKPHLLQW